MGLNPTAADTSPQLIELGKAKTVGVFNQDRVDTRNVQAAFHNRGAKHHVGFACVERHHGALQLPFGHLTVSHQQLQARQHLP